MRAPAPRVEVILLSRNSADTGLRIFNSIQHHGLGITRAVFTSGEPTWPYIRPFSADLFLSANPESVRRSLEHGIAAARASGRTASVRELSVGGLEGAVARVGGSGPQDVFPHVGRLCAAEYAILISQQTGIIY